LRELTKRSAGRFKSTSVAGYERGERNISLERFCELATFYDVSPARLLAHALRAAKGIPPIVIDLTRVDAVQGREGELLAQFARDVVELRGEQGTDAISLRPGDLEVLATISRRKPTDFLQRIRPALRFALEP
jgi:transcriptional regulator with XRE-family HTH domain